MINYHEVLKTYAYRRLVLMGYGVALEVPLENGNGIIDVLGVRKINSKGKGEKIGVECLTRPTKSSISAKIIKYGDYFGKIIFAVFSDSNISSDFKRGKAEIWKFPRTPILESCKKIAEYECNSCFKIFYANRSGISRCPYCSYASLKQTLLLDKENFEIIEYPRNRVKPKGIVILKNPKQILIKKIKTWKRPR